MPRFPRSLQAAAINAATVALAVLCAWLLFYWVQALRAPAPDAPAAPPQPAPVSMQQARRGIVDSGLFGPGDAVVEAPADGKLNIRLVGIVAALGRPPSHAALSMEGQDPAVFGEGEAITASMRVQSIATDHVLISHRGGVQRIELSPGSDP